MADAVSSRGGHPKQFRHIERLIRATALPLGRQSKHKSLRCEAATPRSSAGGRVSNLNANGFFKSLAAL